MVTVLRKEEWGAIQPDGGTQGALNRDLREAEEGTQPGGGEGPGQGGRKARGRARGSEGGQVDHRPTQHLQGWGDLIHPGVPGSSSSQDSEKACSIHVWGITHLPKEAMKTVGVGRCLL